MKEEIFRSIFCCWDRRTQRWWGGKRRHEPPWKLSKNVIIKMHWKIKIEFPAFEYFQKQRPPTLIFQKTSQTLPLDFQPVCIYGHWFDYETWKLFLKSRSGSDKILVRFLLLTKYLIEINQLPFSYRTLFSLRLRP